MAKRAEQAEKVEVPRKPRSKAAALPDTVSLANAAKLLGIEPRSVTRLAADGVFARASKGRYGLFGLVQGYVRSIKEGRRESTTTAAENRVRDARARQFELNMAIKGRELGATVEFEAVMDEVLGYYRAELTGLGSSITRDLDLRRQIDAAVDRVQVRVHSRLQQEIALFRQSAPAGEADAEAEPG